MNKFVVIALAVVIGVAASFGIMRLAEGKTVTVSQIGYSHAKYKGTITVTGIMAGNSDLDRSLFGIMDTQEAKCNAPGCEKLFIPVRFKGKHPAVGDEIKVKGAFVKGEGGVVFNAEKLTVVRHHDLKINTRQAPRKWS